MSKPEVSVLLPVYNEENYLHQSIDSILNQTYKNFELIIIDDGSTDKSIEIINSYKDSRIILIKNEKNLHIQKSLNKGFKQANGVFIARIDGNDIAYNTRFEKQVDYLNNNSNCAVVFCPVMKIDQDGNTLNIVNGNYIPPDLIQTHLFYKNCFFHTSAMMRKSALPNPPYDIKNLAEDYELWTDLARNWNLFILDEILMKVRDIPGGLRYLRGNKKGTLKTKLKQLDWLHIYPNRDELLIHENLETKNRYINPPVLKEKLQWLDKLYLSNKKYRIFHEPYFTNKLVEHWNSFVNKTYEILTLDTFIYLLFSPLRKYTKKSFLYTNYRYMPFIKLKFYLKIYTAIKKTISELIFKNYNNHKVNHNNLINKNQLFDTQYESGFWNYLFTISELAHYSIIVGYTYNWKMNPAILDVGCGEGVLQEKLGIGPYSFYEGIDISQQAIIGVKHKIDSKTSFRIADMEKYDTTMKYDIIIFCEILYYINMKNDLVNLIKQYSNYLNQEGKIIVSIYDSLPNAMEIWNILDEILIQVDRVYVLNKEKVSHTIKVFDKY